MADMTPTKIRGAEHAALIDYIKRHYPLAKTTGFIAALKKLPNADYVPWLLSPDGRHGRSYPVIPDAWFIDPVARRVLVFEAVHRHDLTPEKFGAFVDLAWALDEDYYTLLIIRVDRDGVREFNPQHAYVAYNIDQARAGWPTTDNDIPNWFEYSVDVTAPMLAEYGDDPVCGFMRAQISRMVEMEGARMIPPVGCEAEQSGALLALAERVEALSGPDRFTDEAIRALVFPKSVDGMTSLFTASLDAAMTLVPEGWRTVMANEQTFEPTWVWRLGNTKGRFGQGSKDGLAATPALALTAACLRARASS